ADVGDGGGTERFLRRGRHAAVGHALRLAVPADRAPGRALHGSLLRAAAAARHLRVRSMTDEPSRAVQYRCQRGGWRVAHATARALLLRTAACSARRTMPPCGSARRSA